MFPTNHQQAQGFRVKGRGLCQANRAREVLLFKIVIVLVLLGIRVLRSCSFGHALGCEGYEENGTQGKGMDMLRHIWSW